MRRWGCAALTAVVFSFIATFASAGTRLTFAVPEGWVDLSPGSPEKNFAEVPPPIAAAARAPGIFFSVIDKMPDADGNLATANAHSIGTISTITDRWIGLLAKAGGEGIDKTMPGATHRVVSTGTFILEGEPCGRFESEVSVSGVVLRQMTYVFPDGNDGIALVLTASNTQYAKSKAAFEKAALATKGLSRSPGRWLLLLPGAMARAFEQDPKSFFYGLMGLAFFLVSWWNRRSTRRQSSSTLRSDEGNH